MRVEFHHPEFGSMVNDSNIWKGIGQSDGRTIAFYVSGTDTEPNPLLLNRASNVLKDVAQTERRALEFIGIKAPALKQGVFKLCSADFFWKEIPDSFVLEFTLEGDRPGIWRVEFENGQPKAIGRDD